MEKISSSPVQFALQSPGGAFIRKSGQSPGGPCCSRFAVAERQHSLFPGVRSTDGALLQESRSQKSWPSLRLPPIPPPALTLCLHVKYPPPHPPPVQQQRNGKNRFTWGGLGVCRWPTSAVARSPTRLHEHLKLQGHLCRKRNSHRSHRSYCSHRTPVSQLCGVCVAH